MYYNHNFIHYKHYLFKELTFIMANIIDRCQPVEDLLIYLAPKDN